MGVNQKELRTRIRSVRATRQLTKAMGLVASARIRRSLLMMENGRAYRDSVKELMQQLPPARSAHKAGGGLSAGTRLILISGDRGMAGGFNQRLFRLLSLEADAQVIPIGKRAAEWCGNSEYPSAEHFSAEDCAALASKLYADYQEGCYDRLLLLFTRFQNMLTQLPEYQTVLPFLQPQEPHELPDLLWEPAEDEVRTAVTQAYLKAMIFSAVKESLASETAARMAAMDTAGRNAEEMLDDLQLLYNRARQGAITQEITEIVAGAGLE